MEIVSIMGKIVVVSAYLHMLTTRTFGTPLVSLLSLSTPSIVSFCGTKTNNTDLGPTPQNTVSDQGLHCLLTESSFRIYTEQK